MNQLERDNTDNKLDQELEEESWEDEERVQIGEDHSQPNPETQPSENADSKCTGSEISIHGVISSEDQQQGRTIQKNEELIRQPLFTTELTENKLKPSVEVPPTLELKPLPDFLKYMFLGPNNTLPVIISAHLQPEEEEQLQAVLQECSSAIGWTIADIKGISPSICMHKILLEEGAQPVRERQRRLNPLMMEVLKKEIIKLLDFGMIFPISDSEWVSPVQCVPKKGGVTVVTTEDAEVIATRVINAWRVCMDYRRLNQATRKDHFPLPYLDQILDKIAGHAFYCFLDGYSGYNQILIAPEDQAKTTFTCPFGTFAYKRMPFGLCNAPATFQRSMMSIFSDMIENCMEVFMDDFSVYGDSF